MFLLFKQALQYACRDSDIRSAIGGTGYDVTINDIDVTDQEDFKLAVAGKVSI